MTSSITNANNYLFLFAPDAKYFKNVNSYSEQQILQQDINSLYNWSIKWHLYLIKLNVSI